jgi:hypothetical protein
MPNTPIYNLPYPELSDPPDGPGAFEALADATETALGTVLDSAVNSTVIDAKGDLLVGTAADTLGRLPVGTNGQALVADSTDTEGMRWSPVVSPSPVALADAATIVTNASLGTHFRVTLGGNRTLGNPTNAVDGQKLLFEIIQDATGSRTLALDTKFALGTDVSAVTLTTTASKRDFLGVVYNASADKFYVLGFLKGY